VKHGARKLFLSAILLIGLNFSANAIYVEGNPLTNADPTGLVPVPRLPAPMTPDPALPKPPTDDGEMMCFRKNCSQIRAMCRAQCSDIALPTQDFGMTFFRCVNTCVSKNGC